MSLHTAYSARASNKHLERASCVLGNHTTHWNSASMNLFAKKTLLLFWDISGYTKVQKCQDPLSILGHHNPTPTPSHTSHSSTPICTVPCLPCEELHFACTHTMQDPEGLLCTGQVLHPLTTGMEAFSVPAILITLNPLASLWFLFLHSIYH